MINILWVVQVATAIVDRFGKINLLALHLRSKIVSHL